MDLPESQFTTKILLSMDLGKEVGGPANRKLCEQVLVLWLQLLLVVVVLLLELVLLPGVELDLGRHHEASGLQGGEVGEPGENLAGGRQAWDIDLNLNFLSKLRNVIK